jgi:hypothetical protein
MAGTDECFERIRQDLLEKGIDDSDASELAKLESYGGRWNTLSSEQNQRKEELRTKYQEVLQ